MSYLGIWILWEKILLMVGVVRFLRLGQRVRRSRDSRARRRRLCKKGWHRGGVLGGHVRYGPSLLRGVNKRLWGGLREVSWIGDLC